MNEEKGKKMRGESGRGKERRMKKIRKRGKKKKGESGRGLKRRKEEEMVKDARINWCHQWRGIGGGWRGNLNETMKNTNENKKKTAIFIILLFRFMI